MKLKLAGERAEPLDSILPESSSLSLSLTSTFTQPQVPSSRQQSALDPGGSFDLTSALHSHFAGLVEVLHLYSSDSVCSRSNSLDGSLSGKPGELETVGDPRCARPRFHLRTPGRATWERVGRGPSHRIWATRPVPDWCVNPKSRDLACTLSLNRGENSRPGLCAPLLHAATTEETGRGASCAMRFPLMCPGAPPVPLILPRMARTFLVARVSTRAVRLEEDRG